MGVAYRVLQFWNTLTSVPEEADLEQAGKYLPPALMELFLKMQPGEQVHSLQVFGQLSHSGEQSPDLLTAALLHDAGKIRFPLRLWERSVIVLCLALAPGLVEKWGQGEPLGWRRPFVVAVKHAEWGAQMAKAGGASQDTIWLIRHHQDRTNAASGSHTEPDMKYLLLRRLQMVDNES